MPSTTVSPIIRSDASDLEINTYDAASDIPPRVVEVLRRNPTRTNVVLPIIEKAISRELTGDIVETEELWLTCSSIDDEGNRTLDLVLSCSESEMGKYPIFIVATVPFSRLTDQFLVPRIENLILAMTRAGIRLDRVYSIFAPEPITQLFAEIWREFTGVAHYETPYYAAMLSFCTRGSFRNRQATCTQGGVRYNLRPARISDLDAVAALCHGFAAESEPFVLNKAGALEEAQMLIRKEQVWVHETQREGSNRPEIACLVAYTRNTQTTATITKVMTSPAHRGLGCAQRLVRQVCKHLLYSGKQAVALYVAHDNIPACKVYHKVGFVGLDEYHDQPIEGVERWLEIGFDRAKVQLGHW
ncbi:acyl-CoA N-acyltransferase [Lentinula edodes]|nr:acyl-CoA N-acyltransferase [Lentinula edodes]